MTRAQQKGALLRRKLGLSGQVDTEAVANILGLATLPVGIIVYNGLLWM